MKKNIKQVRHPTRKNGVNPTYPHTFISLGTHERKLLRYLFNHQNSRFNLKEYSRITNKPRSTLYEYLNRLGNKGLIDRELANNKITNKGIILLGSTENIENRGVGSSRRECRKESLSTHYHKFKLPITDRSRFTKERIERLSPISSYENRLHNLHQLIIKFNDATVIINPKQLIINLYDVVSKDVEDSDIECMNRAIEYTKKFMKIGIITEGMIIEEGHWARVKSILSDFLYKKVDNKYFLDLGHGRKFWIDHSMEREDETNDKQVRERVDLFLKDAIDSDALLSDIPKITKVLGFITKLESARLMNEIEMRKGRIDKVDNIDKIVKDKPEYIG